jgi:hypothetical protein
VVKAPYTTNCHYIKYPKTVGKVVKCIAKANQELAAVIPYVMLQACMKNRKEYKVVLFNEQVQYLSYNPRKGNFFKHFK